MKRRRMATAFAASLLCAAAPAQLAEYGIEGLWVVSTRDAEVRGTVAPDGQRIVWGSPDRAGGPGGGDLWQARLHDKRWTDPQPLPLDTAAEEAEPFFSADGRWLYFASTRPGGRGGRDLYRAAVLPDGGFGTPQSLGDAVNTRGDERSPTPSADGRWLLFASDGRKGAGGFDLYLAHWNGDAFADPHPLPGVNTAADETDAAWLDAGRALMFSRGDAAAGTSRLWTAACDGRAYADAQPWALSFNTEDADTRAPVVDASKPAELLVTGTARSPKAGKSDLYRALVPKTTGQDGCLL